MNAVCSNVDATEMILLSESEKGKGTRHVTLLICGICKKGVSNGPSMKQKLTHRQRADLGAAKRKGMERGS